MSIEAQVLTPHDPRILHALGDICLHASSLGYTSDAVVLENGCAVFVARSKTHSSDSSPDLVQHDSSITCHLPTRNCTHSLEYPALVAFQGSYYRLAPSPVQLAGSTRSNWSMETQETQALRLLLPNEGNRFVADVHTTRMSSLLRFDPTPSTGVEVVQRTRELYELTDQKPLDTWAAIESFLGHIVLLLKEGKPVSAAVIDLTTGSSPG